LIDHRVARYRTLTHALERYAQILRAIEQDRQARLDDRRRVAAARRKVERQGFIVFRVGKRVQRDFYFSAGRFGAILRPRR